MFDCLITIFHFVILFVQSFALTLHHVDSWLEFFFFFFFNVKIKNTKYKSESSVVSRVLSSLIGANATTHDRLLIMDFEFYT